MNKLTERLPVKGERIELTALHADDLPQLLPFFNDVAALTFYLPTTTRPYNAQQLEKLLLEWNDGVTCFVFAIRLNGQIIGLINLDDVNGADRHAEIGIALTSDDRRGQGYAAEALRLMIDFAFLELDLHRLWARIIEGNNASIRLFKQVGFFEEGRFTEHVRKNGQWKNMLIYGLLQSKR